MQEFNVSPHEVVFCGENPQIQMFQADQKTYSALASYWQAVYSPYGLGDVLILYLDEANQTAHQQPACAIYSNNAELATYLTLTFNQHFPEFKDLGLERIKVQSADFQTVNQAGQSQQVSCKTAHADIKLEWQDVRVRRLFSINDFNGGGMGANRDEHYDVSTTIFLCAQASIQINGQPVAGQILTAEGERFRSSAFMALSETWLKH